MASEKRLCRLCAGFCLVLAQPAMPQNLPDTDGDGIADVYEIFGYSSSGSTIDFPAMGADPRKKDIFLEMDVMQNVTLPAGGVQDVIAAFAEAPVTNPDGSTGINMHVDASGTVPFATEISFSKSTSIGDTFVEPQISVNAGGLTAVAWQDDRDGNGKYEIYARAFDAASNPVTGEISVNSVSDGQQRRPDVAINSVGGFVIVWEDDQDGNGKYEILGRVYSANGTAMTGDINVNPVGAGQQRMPSVGMDAAGNWVAAWQDDRDGNGKYEIFARRFDLAGNALSGEAKVNPVGSGQQRKPRVALSTLGRGVVVWEDDRDGNGKYEIFARRLSGAGAPTGGEISVNPVSAGQQRGPDVDMNAGADFVIVWEDDRDGNGKYEIFARRFNANGTANGDEILVNAVSSGMQRDPAVAVNGLGRFTVTWEDDQDGNGKYEVLARTFNANGTARTGNRVINTDSTDDQINPAVGMTDSGVYTVAYQDDRDRNNDWVIFMRRRNQDGGSVSGDIEVHDIPAVFGRLKKDHFANVRKSFFHYGVVANQRVGTGSSGIAEIDGDDFIVSLGMNPSRARFAGTFMHELGHNLNLKHGGNEGKNRKPNHLSVMSYRYQFGGADNDCDATSSSAAQEDLNYSLGRRFKLVEDDLDERIGICNGEKDVNWVSSGQQRDPAASSNGSGRFVVAWEDDRDSNGKYEIFARAYAAAGQPVGTETKVNPVGAGQQRDPAVGMRGDGGFVVVWEDDRDGNGKYEIFAQRMTPQMSRVGAEIQVNVESDGQQRDPDIALADDGHFAVVWEDDRDGNGKYEIFARRFDANGAAVSAEVKVNPVGDGQQRRPRVAMANDHRFAVVWEDDRDGNGKYEIFARPFAANGSASGGEVLVNTISSGQQRYPDVGIANDGRFIVVWEDDNDNNGKYEILARRIGAGGNGLGNQFTVNQDGAGQQRKPRVVAGGSFAFAVVWEDDRDGNGKYEIFARPFAANGTARADERKINPLGSGQQRLPDIGIDSNDQFYVAWQDDRDGNGKYEIFAVRASAAGTPRDRTAIDWDGDGNSNESSVSMDINSDTDTDRLNDHNDWSRVKLDF